ncbi:MAG: ATP-binding protein [Proteobacteria bacterium]|nr:ATP-binding protein [Pseudomonadota bacterium]
MGIKEFCAGNLQAYASLTLKFLLILSIINSIYLGLWHLMSTNLFILILLFIPSFVKSYKVNIPCEFEWFLIVFVASTFFISKIHWAVAPLFFGISVGLIGFLILLILYSNNQIKKNYTLILTYSFNFALAFGAALEILKYLLKIALGHTLEKEHYLFAMNNLLYVIAGATIATICGFVYMKYNKGILTKFVEKFIKVNPKLFSMATIGDIEELIKKGEDDKTEFKSTLRVNMHTNEIDKRMEISVLKTIVGFLNTKSGTLLIGVSNKGEITGLGKDRFETQDKYSLHLNNIIKEKIGKKYLHLIDFNFVKINEKSVLKIDCRKSKKPIFLKNQNEEEFYIRIGPSTAQLKGSELVDYIEREFNKKK